MPRDSERRAGPAAELRMNEQPEIAIIGEMRAALLLLVVRVCWRNSPSTSPPKFDIAAASGASS